MTKKEVYSEVDEIDITAYSAQGLIDRVRSMMALYGENLSFDSDTRPYSDSMYISVKLRRLETDEEYKVRTDQESRWKAAAEEADRKRYLALKKKFGDDAA